MKTTRQSYKERSVLIVDFVNGEYECYDGDENFKMSINDFKDRCNNFFKDDKLLVNKDFTRESKLMDTIDEAYDYYIKLADELKKESDGLFNMYKCPTIKNMALNHFLMIRRPPRSTQSRSSAASDVYKRQHLYMLNNPSLSFFSSSASLM